MTHVLLLLALALPGIATTDITYLSGNEPAPVIAHDTPQPDSKYLLVRRIPLGRGPHDESGLSMACLVMHPPGDWCSYDYPMRSVATFHATLDDVATFLADSTPESVVGCWKIGGREVKLAPVETVEVRTEEVRTTTRSWTVRETKP